MRGSETYEFSLKIAYIVLTFGGFFWWLHRMDDINSRRNLHINTYWSQISMAMVALLPSPLPSHSQTLRVSFPNLLSFGGAVSRAFAPNVNEFRTQAIYLRFVCGCNEKMERPTDGFVLLSARIVNCECVCVCAVCCVLCIVITCQPNNEFRTEKTFFCLDARRRMRRKNLCKFYTHISRAKQ